MNEFPARRFTTTQVICLPLLIWMFFLPSAHAQYLDRLNEICYPCSLDVFFHAPAPIGDLGKIDLVVDLRGFIPMSLPRYPSDSLAVRILEGPQFPRKWFRIPTRQALMMLYYDALPLDKIADGTSLIESDRFVGTVFSDEAGVKGNLAPWVELAYKLAKESGPLFDQIAGGSGFQAAEPTTVFFTQRSAFVILSIKYTSANGLVGDQGQVLVALEFSRSSKQYKTLYLLYSTLLLSKPAREVATAVAPYIAKAVIGSF